MVINYVRNIGVFTNRLMYVDNNELRSCVNCSIYVYIVKVEYI